MLDQVVDDSLVVDIDNQQRVDLDTRLFCEICTNFCNEFVNLIGLALQILLHCVVVTLLHHAERFFAVPCMIHLGRYDAHLA